MSAGASAAITYLDTSAVATAMWPGTQAHDPALQHLQRIRDNGLPIYFSTFLRVEFLQALVSVANDPTRLPSSTRRSYQLHRWGDFPHARRRWFRDGLTELDAFLYSFDGFHEIDLDSHITANAAALMADYMLKSYDALHVASAQSVGATDFVTVDADFLRVPDDIGLTIHLIR